MATASDAEKVLHEASCTYKRGVLNHAGQAVLTARRIIFRPTRFEQLAGAKEWTLELASISRIQRRKPDDMLELFAGANVQRLNGDGTKGLETALRKALDALSSTPADPVQLGEGEVLLLHTPGQLYRDGVVSRKGELTVTTQRFCFSPSGLDKFNTISSAFDVPLGHIQNVTLEGGLVQVTTVDNNGWTIGNVAAVRLFGLLCGLPRPDMLELDGYRTFPAVVADIKSPHPGLLQITRDRIRFGERREGGMQAELAMHEVTRCQLSAIKGDRMELRRGNAALALVVSQSDTRFAEVFRLMAECAAPSDPETDSDGFLTPEGISQVIAPWNAELSGKTAASILCAGPAAMMRWPETARRGWVLLSKGDLHFVPAGGPGCGEKVLTLNHGEFQFQTPLPGQPAALLLSLADETVQVLPRGGETFVKRFRQMQESLDRPTVGSTPGVRANRRGTFRASPPGRMTIRVGAVFDGVVVRPSAFIEGRLLDISADGCRVVTDAPVEKTTTVQLEIPHKPAPVKIHAVIMNARPPSEDQPSWRLGLRFSQQSAQQDKVIRELWMGFQQAASSARQRVEEERR